MVVIRINELPVENSPSPSEFTAIDGASTRKVSIQNFVDSGAPVASQAEAQSGTDNTKRMTPLTTKQSISSEVGVTVASQANGALASTAVQPSRQIISGNGLSGGGDLSGDRTLNVGAGTGILVTTDAVSLDATTLERLLPSGGSIGQALIKTSATNYDVEWSNAGAGDVVGPSSAVDNFPVAFDSTTGKLIKAITGAIAALHALAPAADKLPYFSGGSAASLADLTAFARTILDDANGAAMFATMGFTSWGSGTSRGIKLPDGTIYQWAGSVAVTGGNLGITFPIAFPNAVYAVVGAPAHPPAGTNSTYACWASDATTTGFSGRAREIQASGVPVAASLLMTYFATGTPHQRNDHVQVSAHRSGGSLWPVRLPVHRIDRYSDPEEPAADLFCRRNGA